jgi:hypothetical protein
MYANYASSYNELLTFQDAVDRVLLANGCRQGHPGEFASARNAVIDAMRQIPGKFNWNYYRRVLMLATAPPTYNLNATYTHTGGDVERQLRLNSGTWPSNAADCKVLMLNTLFDVDARVDSTTLQLRLSSNPGRNLPAQSVTICKPDYQIGTRVRRVLSLLEAQTDLPIDYKDYPSLLRFLHVNPTPSTPVMFNIHQGGERINSLELTFAPPPLDIRSYALAIEAQPRQLRVYADDFTVTTSNATVTATSGTFTQAHVGSVIRFSGSSIKPTGSGGYTDNYNPYIEQRILKSVTNQNVAVMDSGLSSDITVASAAVVTDPLDIDHNSMLGYFLAMCNRIFAQNSPGSARLQEFLSIEEVEKRSAIANNDYVHTDLLTQTGLLGMPDTQFVLSFPVTEF